MENKPMYINPINKIFFHFITIEKKRIVFIIDLN